METGRRSDIVLSDGLRCTSFLRFPDDQSRYSVESAVAQNFLSSSSLLNSGSAFFFRSSFLRFPDDQSRYSVESAVAQNFLSSSSLLNSGSAFFFVSSFLRFPDDQ